MKIAFGVDPSGWALHDSILSHLKETGHEALDLGTTDLEHNRVPYMYVGKAVAQAVTGGAADFGIVVCGNGLGVCMAANKNKGARCMLGENWYLVRDSRIINNANILALGGTMTSPRMANEMIDVFLSTPWCAGMSEAQAQDLQSGDASFRQYEEEQFG
ncbi:MAG: RpiB/LacA/LacB family sugar-phosphate isomerase [Candidatus Onthomonas sp.]